MYIQAIHRKSIDQLQNSLVHAWTIRQCILNLHAVERHILSRLFYSVYGTIKWATSVKAKKTLDIHF